MEQAQRVLIVEDDVQLSQLLAVSLKEHGFEPVIITSGSDINEVAAEIQADVILLDVMLPHESGFDICRRIRKRSSIPIIILTALSSEIDRVVGLESGADDYLTKPFSTRELVARVRALLRRTQVDRSGPAILAEPAMYAFSGWTLEPSSRQLTSPHSAAVALTGAEFDLLLAFCRKPGTVLSRDQLLSLMHSGSAGSMTRSIDVHISRIRLKLEDSSQGQELIKTVRLGGYVFTPTVQLLWR